MNKDDLRISIVSLPNGQQVMGKVIEEDDDVITMEDPINVVVANPLSTDTAVYTSRYMPLAKQNTVFFQKMNLVSFAYVQDALIEHYLSMIEYYKSRPYNYSADRQRTDSDNKEVQEIERAILKNQKEDPLDVLEALAEAKNKKLH